MRLSFTQVDAFASRPFTGNPAAVVMLEAWPEDALLQAIAAENNLAETAFLVPADGGDADHELRWFTPAVEVALCGHATLASGHVLLAADPALARVRFRTRRAGLLEVAREGAGYTLDLPAWETVAADPPETAAAIGAAPRETRWRDGGYALLIYDHEDEVCALAPDFRALGRGGDILYVCTAPGRETDIVSRAFAPGAGIDEDPVTGSAHALLTRYWCARLGRDAFTAYQASARGGHLGCRLAGERAILSGGCVTVIEGVLTV